MSGVQARMTAPVEMKRGVARANRSRREAARRDPRRGRRPRKEENSARSLSWSGQASGQAQADACSLSPAAASPQLEGRQAGSLPTPSPRQGLQTPGGGVREGPLGVHPAGSQAHHVLRPGPWAQFLRFLQPQTQMGAKDGAGLPPPAPTPNPAEGGGRRWCGRLSGLALCFAGLLKQGSRPSPRTWCYVLCAVGVPETRNHKSLFQGRWGGNMSMH